jgi:transcriptional regulator with XRE-family HTH domain
MVTTGERIRELRKAKKWTQQELADKLGLDRTTISKWERQGGSEPDNATITKIADIFDVSTDYLLGRVTSPSETRDLPQTIAPYLPEGFDKLPPEAKEEIYSIVEYVMAKYKKKEQDGEK